MAYSTGTFSTAEALLVALSSFASTNGWTIDDTPGSSADKFALHKNSCYASFRYDSSDTTGNQIVSVHQATGHTASVQPGLHPGDSGNGYNGGTQVSSTYLDNERHVDVGLSDDELPSTYHFFEHDDGTIYYIHIVLRRSDGVHRHFGFGFFSKFGTWTGGEYAYGHYVSSSISTGYHYSGAYHCCLLDGRFAPTSGTPRMAATVRLASFPDQVASGAWGEVMLAKEADTADDHAGIAKYRIQGGYRAGPVMRALGNMRVGRKNGFVNLIPIHLWAYHEEAAAADRVRYLGYMPDVRGIVLDGIADGETITVGTEDWVCFPSVKRGTLSAGDYNSRWQGIAYRMEVL